MKSGLTRSNNISERSYAGGSRQGQRLPRGIQLEQAVTDPAVTQAEHRGKGEQKVVRVLRY